MPDLIYALLCADLIVDKDSGSTSFIRAVEHAVVPELPAALPPIYFASLWDLEGNNSKPFTLSLILTPPAGEPVTLGTQEVQTGDTMLHKMNFQIPSLRVEVQGKHTLGVAILKGEEWEILAELPLYVFEAEKKDN